jgi:hypothetical protein
MRMAQNPLNRQLLDGTRNYCILSHILRHRYVQLDINNQYCACYRLLGTNIF